MADRFWIRVLFYLAILGALIYVGYTAGGDPCDRCELEIKEGLEHSGQYTCREIINEFVVPLYGEWPEEKMPPINFSRFGS